MKNSNFPIGVQEHFLHILDKEREYVGEKYIDNGFLIKRNKDKATISYDNGEAIYAAKMIRANNEWRVIGIPSIWANIKELLHF